MVMDVDEFRTATNKTYSDVKTRCYIFLRENKGKAFTAREVANGIKEFGSMVSNSLMSLERHMSEIVRKKIRPAPGVKPCYHYAYIDEGSVLRDG